MKLKQLLEFVGKDNISPEKEHGDGYNFKAYIGQKLSDKIVDPITGDVRAKKGQVIDQKLVDFIREKGILVIDVQGKGMVGDHECLKMCMADKIKYDSGLGRPVSYYRDGEGKLRKSYLDQINPHNGYPAE